LITANTRLFAAGVHVLLSLQELELRPVHFDVNIPAGEIDYDNQLKQTSRLHAKGVAELVNNSLGEIRVKGWLAVDIEGSCDRCLDIARLAVKRDFDLCYFPSEQFAAGGEDALDEEASDIAYYDGDRLDLNEILREVVLLAVPMQIICSEDCKGICPNCGQNRNIQDCRCEAPVVDDRWSKLKALRAELSPEH
jgi:uncharacterized protein